MTQTPFAILQSYSCLALTLALARCRLQNCLPHTTLCVQSRQRPLALCLCRRRRVFHIAPLRCSCALFIARSWFEVLQATAALELHLLYDDRRTAIDLLSGSPRLVMIQTQISTPGYPQFASRTLLNDWKQTNGGTKATLSDEAKETKDATNQRS